MQNRNLPKPISPLRKWAMRRARRGDADSKTVIIIGLSVVAGVALLCCGGMALMLLPAIRQAREAARRTEDRNNLHNIGIALHNYHDVYMTFPPGGVYAEDGTEYISWQTSILPYVEQYPLYDRMDMNVPWTDPVNRGNYSTVVQDYLHPSIADSPVNAQGLAVSHYAGNSHVFGPNSSTRVRDITDGTSNTVLVGDVAAGFKPWGDPTNVRDPAAGIAIGPDTFCGPASQNGVFFLFGDGAVRFLDDNVSQEVLDAIATPDGQEVVPMF